MKTIDNLEQMTDGQEYGPGDMVKADPVGCEGCHACCLEVDDYVTLNPYDIYQMQAETQLSIEQLLEGHLTFTTEKKLNLPHLKTVGADRRCSFLNSDNRCAIHSARPDICRLFPLARAYDSDDFHYVLQVGACVKPKLDKVKVKKHLGIDHYNTYKAFIWSWYQVIKALSFRLRFAREEEAIAEINQIFWQGFYSNPTLQQAESPVSFIEAYFELLPEIKQQLGIL